MSNLYSNNMIDKFILKISGKNAKLRKEQKQLMTTQANSIGFNGIPYRNNKITKTYQKHLNQYVKKNTDFKDGVAVRDGKITRTYKKRGPRGKFERMETITNLMKHHKSFFAKPGDLDRPLTVTFKSGVVKNLKKDFNFRNRAHLMFFLEKMEKENVMDSSYSMFKKFQDVAKRSGKSSSNLNSVWDFVSLALKFQGGGGDKNRETYPNIKLNNWKLKTCSPASKGNNCALRCLEMLYGVKLDGRKVRNEFKLERNQLIGADMVYKIYNNNIYNNSETKIKPFNIIDLTYEGEFKLDTENYIILHNDHYTIVTEAEKTSFKHKKTKRGLLTWDLETRPTDEFIYIAASDTKSYVLCDTICSIYYQSYKSDEKHTKTFVTDSETRSVDKFKQWLSDESKNGRTYTAVSHNGSRFDHFIFCQKFSENDLLESEMQLRGTSIIGMQYKSHIFKDSCLFLTNSLSNLCQGFLRGEQTKFAKIENIEIDNVMMTNKELCFYKPELGFNEFLELQNKEPKFFQAYIMYCEYDVISLFLVWQIFSNEMQKIIGKIGKYMLNQISLISSNTIGSLCKKILDASVGISKRGESKYLNGYYKTYLKFMNDDKEKYEFIKNFKRGGISHCNQPGKHNEGVVGVDIVSQYPSSMLYQSIPSGFSNWIDVYDEKMHGYYELKNVKFKDASFKPCASVLDSGVLEWNNETIEHIYLDSYLIKYMSKHCGLISFDVVKGLVSNHDVLGSKIFGKYVNTLFEEKAQQDVYKKANSDEYNPAYREVIKLCLNSVTGKMNENPSVHFSLEFDPKNCKQIDDDTKCINGVKCYKEKSTCINIWLNAGVQIYSYSKRLLFEYINCLPFKSNSVIHVETDGIYFPKPCRNAFETNLANYDGEYKEVSYGKHIGGLDLEKDSTETAYYLGKKFYYLDGVCKIKGVPLKTITPDGKDVQLVDKSTYEKIYAGEQIKIRFTTIQRSLYDSKRNNKMSLSTHYMNRTIKPQMEYKEYN